nr:uncharacterized protein LOC119172944 [Rhipicephalus microplus]
MKEANLIRLVNVFSISRIIYVAPFRKLTLTDKKKLNIMIRRCYKCALHLSMSTPNAKLNDLGLHNTIDEFIEAQRISHYKRLGQTRTGRHLMCSLGIPYVSQFGQKLPIPSDIRDTFVILPISRSMHPEYNVERRVDRAKQLGKRYAKATYVAYVDAAEYPTHRAMALAVATGPQYIITATGTIRANKPEEGEEAAIALAYASTQASSIISDSNTAIRNFTKGLISQPALRILTSTPLLRRRRVEIVWTPGHSGLAGNEHAHDAARALVHRARHPTEHHPSRPDAAEREMMVSSFRDNARDRMLTFGEILMYYRKARLKYPPPDNFQLEWPFR